MLDAAFCPQTGPDKRSSASSAQSRLSLLNQEEAAVSRPSEGRFSWNPGRTDSEEDFQGRDGGASVPQRPSVSQPLLIGQFLLLEEKGRILMKVGLTVSVLLQQRETLDGDEETTSTPPPSPPSPARSGLLNADMPDV